ncbi:GGDEF domain-containing protein [uncultured Amphritea sp.]|uniref:transporter substrate-binding domain-containing diguanylate cyclase n=1 Tax=uncultured Amphritea sp. TaxID=981605 RepID=UPI00262195C8|nr:GGDEF domain-containing protein [uncultured Amphritea sp.]
MYINVSQKISTKGLLIVLFAGWFLFVMNSAVGQTTDDIGLTQAESAYLKAKKVLHVCVDPDRLPFDGVDKNRQHDGLSKDYFDIFSRMLGVEMVVPEVQDWNDLISKAKSRECDVVSQINASEERRSYLDFTTPYFYLPLAVVTRYDRIFVEESLEGAGTQFAVIKGDIAIDKLRKRYPRIDLIEVKNNIQAMELVYDGEVFGYIGAQGAVAFAIQSLDLNKLAVTGSLPLRYELSVATRNDEPLLGSAFEKAVLHIDPKEGQSIRDKWIAITIEKVTDYTLLWLTLLVLGTVLIVSLYWNHYLARANRTILETLKDLHDVRVQLEDQNLLFKQQSITDALTGIYNRLKLDEDLCYAVKRSERTKREFSVILLDIDNFKLVNDSFGHLLGDEVLKAFAALLVSAVRQTDIVGRWGGEEFLIICPDTDLQGVSVLAEQLRKKIAEHPFPEEKSLNASLGVVAHNRDEQADAVIARVDKALYRAKDKGRNRVEVG